MALAFAGNSGDRVSLAGAVPSLDTPYTLSLYVAFDDFGDDRMLAYLIGQYDASRDDYKAGNSGWVAENEDGAASGGGTPSTGTWYHVALVRSGLASQRLYVNGVQVAHNTADTGPAPRNTMEGLYLGCHPFGYNAMKGKMAAVKVWGAALSLAEIEAEGTQVSPVRDADLLAFWPLLEGDLATDYSGAGRHLTVSGPTFTTGPDIPFEAGGGGAWRIVTPFGSLLGFGVLTRRVRF